jgi:hypothetical protein
MHNSPELVWQFPGIATYGPLLGCVYKFTAFSAVSLMSDGFQMVQYQSHLNVHHVSVNSLLPAKLLQLWCVLLLWLLIQFGPHFERSAPISAQYDVTKLLIRRVLEISCSIDMCFTLREPGFWCSIAYTTFFIAFSCNTLCIVLLYDTWKRLTCAT